MIPVLAFLLGLYAGPVEAPVYPSVRARLLPILAQFEGDLLYMYPDGEGRVACGIGTDINSPAAANLLRWIRLDGTWADPSEVEAEWMRVRGLRQYRREGGGSSRFRDSAQLHVDPDSLEEYTDGLLADDERVIRQPQFLGAAYDTMPADAQLARLRTMYADGPESPWPKMDAAIRAGNFLEAAAESRPHDYWTQNPAYRRSYDMVKVLYENAAYVVARGLDRTVLYWPRRLSEESTETDPAS